MKETFDSGIALGSLNGESERERAEREANRLVGLSIGTGPMDVSTAGSSRMDVPQRSGGTPRQTGRAD